MATVLQNLITHFLHTLPHNTIWYILGWFSFVKFKVKIEVNKFLCLITHQDINVMSEKYIIVITFAAYYMKGESNKEVKVYCHHFVTVFQTRIVSLIKVKASAAKVNAE